MKAPSGFILYEGPSRFDGSPIVVVATGFADRSRNEKTGDVIQTWIIRSDVSPMEALAANSDTAICSDCPLRGEHGHDRGCYVNVGRAPQAVFRGLKRGVYIRYHRRKHTRWFRGRKLRIGSYGDPCAVPANTWTPLLPLVDSYVGYTHQWSWNPQYRHFVMASCESEAGYFAAVADGWRVFRARLEDQPLLDGECVCRNEASGLQCADCGGCCGESNRPNFAIIVHGGCVVKANAYRTLSAL
jgi:hypothetical protein